MDPNRPPIVDGETSNKKIKMKIVWDSVIFLEFINACVDELRKGNRPGTHFNKVGWANIEKTMKEKTGKVGWEGTAHDTRIFNEALQRPELHFPRPTGDKYYLVDAGYPNTKGYLAPYKGANIRYHLPDFRRGQTRAMRAPRGPKETFNYYHSSLRNIIERTFGVWKARWALLRDMHVNYTFEHQVSIVIALMAVHNFIRKAGQFDEGFNRAENESYNPLGGGTSNEAQEEGPSSRRTNSDDLYMAAVRDIIAQDIMELRR